MPRKSPADVLQHIHEYLRAWERNAPDSVFWNMTLEQFKAAVRPSEEKRTELLDLTERTQRVIAERDSADATSLRLCEGVALGVRGHPTFGPDSMMYAALGFVRKSAKRRRRKKRRI